MSHPTRNERGRDLRVPLGITIFVGAASAIIVGYWGWRALSRADTEPMESPLILSVARQLVDGPSGLYGPFDGGNPLVLIHAPLYYRLAAMAAWPMARAGLDPVTAAQVAGRSLSVLALLVTLGLAYRLARLDGAPMVAGWWSVFLILSSPILGGFPFAVRPDMVGIALQTGGIWLVLSALQTPRPGVARILGGFAAFGLAVCVKQHDVVAPAISSGLLFAACRGGRVPWRWLVSGLIMASSIVAAICGAEEYVTGGRMSQAVFFAAAYVGRIHPADWDHVWIIAIAVLGRTIGLIAVLTAARLAVLWADRGLGRRAFAGAGSVVVVLLVGFFTLQSALLAEALAWGVDRELTDRIGKLGTLGLIAGFVSTLAILPACLLIEGRSYRGGRLDWALIAYVVAELLLMTVLTRISAGAWANYAIEAGVLGGVVAGRALSRARVEAPSSRLVAFASSAVLVGAFLHVYEFEGNRRLEQLELKEVFRHIGRPPSEFFFAERPEQNRADGRLELVFDDWLYPVFESIGLAEPRNLWLGRALTSGSIQVVVTTSEDRRVAGIATPLGRLRYYLALRSGPFFVWVREDTVPR